MHFGFSVRVASLVAVIGCADEGGPGAVNVSDRDRTREDSGSGQQPPTTPHDAAAGTSTGSGNAPQGTVQVRLLGRGRVRSEPLGIDCPGVCRATFDLDSAIALVAEPSPHASLAAWSESGCDGERCELVVQDDTRVEVSFETRLRNYAFVTSSLQAADFGGIEGADAACAASATAAGLSGEYIAWISTQTQNARDRIVGTVGGWMRRDGEPFAATLQELLNGAVLYPLRIDENGQDVGDDGSPVFTATHGDGTFFADGLYTDCENWTSTRGELLVRTGMASSGTLLWTAGNGGGCSRQGRLYCLGVDDALDLAVEHHQGRLAWLSEQPFASGSGIGAADDLCAREAEEHGQAESVLALLGGAGESAASRFADGRPWVRRDGVAVVERAADLLGGQLLSAALSLQLDGDHEGTTGVWSGAASPAAIPGAQETCASWTSSEGDGRHGMSGYTGEPFFDNAVAPCSTEYLHVYCLER